jgi:hypothetical protein
MKPPVIVLNLHLAGRKVVLVVDRRDEQKKVELPSRLERSFVDQLRIRTCV